MKRTMKNLYALGAMALMVLGVTSCSNDLGDLKYGPQSANGIVNPIVAPDAVVWSGTQTFGNSINGAVSTRTDEETDVVTSEFVITDLIDWNQESPVIENILKEESDNQEKLVDTDFLFFAEQELTFEFYPVYLSTNQQFHDIGVFYYDKSGQMHLVKVWSKFHHGDWGENQGLYGDSLYDWETPGANGEKKNRGCSITVKQGYKFGFYWDGRTQNANETDTTYYSKSDLNHPVVIPNSNPPRASQLHAGTFVATDPVSNESVTYLGMEDWTDCDYQDMVIKCNKILKTVDKDNIGWNVPDEEFTDGCPGKYNPGHYCPHGKDSHNTDTGICEECQKEDPSWTYPCQPCPDCDDPFHGTPKVDPCPDCDDPEDECYQKCPEDVCGHPAHPGKDCPLCPEGTDPCHPSKTPGTTPSNPGSGSNKYEQNEVEINLSLNDVHKFQNALKYDIADLVSKLSIHVRYPHDVEVILPVPEKIYCNQDDLYILKDHYADNNGDPNWTYGSFKYNSTTDNVEFEGETHYLHYEIGDNPVDLIIEYVPAGKDELTKDGITAIDGGNYGNGYISVRTQGINEDVIKYCRENFGDGINFEVYNYYNRGNLGIQGNFPEIDFKTLQYNYLSRSLVNFDWEQPDATKKAYPDFYINAFHQINNLPVYNDCYVWILGDNHAKGNDSGLYPDNAVTGTGTTVNWKHLAHAEGTTEIDHFRKPKQGEHFNSSPYNWIYTSENITGAVDSNDMMEPEWPFAKTGNTEPAHYFRIDANENYWKHVFTDGNW